MIPAGTGTFAMASRRVEITSNTYENNQAVDIALISGLVVEDAAAWELSEASLVGDWDDLGLLAGDTAGTITNFRNENIVVSGNSHSGSGTKPFSSLDQELGLLLRVLYSPDPVDNVLYDTIGESSFNETDPTMNSNDNHICVGGNTNGTFASIQLDLQAMTDGSSPILRLPTAPFAPFDCTALDGGPAIVPSDAPVGG
ncbi:MAG: hypothetical protein H5U40_08550 [Polyangiaceae bacterium]|nr:hypothetical protein [Polyangiaceae bacterium]